MPDGIAMAQPVNRPHASPLDSISCVGHVVSSTKNTLNTPVTPPTSTQISKEKDWQRTPRQKGGE